jgi:ubiquinol-cytochrome c reductase cytochrome b subunit
MLVLHVAFLPLIVGVIVIVHVLLVRRRGVVPPFDDADLAEASEEAAAPAERESVRVAS